MATSSPTSSGAWARDSERSESHEHDVEMVDVEAVTEDEQEVITALLTDYAGLLEGSLHVYAEVLETEERIALEDMPTDMMRLHAAKFKAAMKLAAPYYEVAEEETNAGEKSLGRMVESLNSPANEILFQTAATLFEPQTDAASDSTAAAAPSDSDSCCTEQDDETLIDLEHWTWISILRDQYINFCLSELADNHASATQKHGEILAKMFKSHMFRMIGGSVEDGEVVEPHYILHVISKLSKNGLLRLWESLVNELGDPSGEQSQSATEKSFGIRPITLCGKHGRRDEELGDIY